MLEGQVARNRKGGNLRTGATTGVLRGYTFPSLNSPLALHGRNAPWNLLALPPCSPFPPETNRQPAKVFSAVNLVMAADIEEHDLSFGDEER